ncbi:transmembrane protein -like, partial [Brachionus plicatilis]
KKLSNFDTIDDLSIQLCWAELSQLMQCDSPFQEECMDLFIESLENAKLSSSQIPTLFFLAETIIYWIRTDTVNQPFLRAFEIKLLKVGKMIFERIYIHFMDKSLDDQHDLVDHLSIYLQGFSDLKAAYSPYPDAFLYIEFMIKIGDIVGTHVNHPKSATNTTVASYFTDSERRLSMLDQFLWSTIELFKLLKSKYDRKILDEFLTTFDSLVFRDENWLDASLSLYILAECSKINIKALDIFLQLSFKDDDYEDRLIRDEISPRKTLKSSGLFKWSIELTCVYVELLADICINGSSPLLKRKALLGNHKEAADVFNNGDAQVFGLLDTAKFAASPQSDWMVRYMAVKGLVRICKSLNDKQNEEFRQISWACLVIFQESEKNTNVLEALKVGQINSKIEPLIKKEKVELGRTNVYCRFAYRLGDLRENGVPKSQMNRESYVDEELKDVRLESLPESASVHNKSILTNTETKLADHAIVTAKRRTTLKDELLISSQFETKVPDYYERKNIDLMRIVEDQFRKDLRDNLHE